MFDTASCARVCPVHFLQHRAARGAAPPVVPVQVRRLPGAPARRHPVPVVEVRVGKWS